MNKRSAIYETERNGRAISVNVDDEIGLESKDIERFLNHVENS